MGSAANSNCQNRLKIGFHIIDFIGESVGIRTRDLLIKSPGSRLVAKARANNGHYVRISGCLRLSLGRTLAGHQFFGMDYTYLI
jgi:hypothetical protein